MSLGKLTDKILENEKVRKKVVSFITGVTNHSCKDYDHDGKCNQKMKECHYAINENNEVKCEHYPKKDKGDSDKNINSDIFSRPAYR